MTHPSTERQRHPLTSPGPSNSWQQPYWRSLEDEDRATSNNNDLLDDENIVNILGATTEIGRDIVEYVAGYVARSLRSKIVCVRTIFLSPTEVWFLTRLYASCPILDVEFLNPLHATNCQGVQKAPQTTHSRRPDDPVARCPVSLSERAAGGQVAVGRCPVGSKQCRPERRCDDVHVRARGRCLCYYSNRVQVPLGQLFLLLNHGHYTQPRQGLAEGTT
ncbi:hypothetical protein J6590_039703 [Homalodisca vitripennis]|nr:hypothetical protein J6590_039703 [Homalodisca vitripennis]